MAKTRHPLQDRVDDLYVDALNDATVPPSVTNLLGQAQGALQGWEAEYARLEAKYAPRAKSDPKLGPILRSAKNIGDKIDDLLR